MKEHTMTEPRSPQGEDSLVAADPKMPVEAIIEFVTRRGMLFHDAHGTGYVLLALDGHLETWQLKSASFRDLIKCRFLRENGRVLTDSTINSAIAILDARARFESRQQRVHVRVGSHRDEHYLDLCDDAYRAVQINADGWRIDNSPLVNFVRHPGMLALPGPVRGGSIELLRQYLNVTDADFVLIVSFLLAALRDQGPYPVLVVMGEAGSAKSTLLRVLRSLVDPNAAPLRGHPRSEHDIVIAGKNAHMLAYDNLSSLPTRLSDAFAHVASGGGSATRALWTRDQEQIFVGAHPVMLGSIEHLVVRGDLADRAIFVRLGSIPDTKRRTEREFWAAFERDRPLILGALLDGVAHGLRLLTTTQLDRLPRVADFLQWGVACEGAFWSAGAVVSAYYENRALAVADVLEDDSVAVAVREFMTQRENWSGTATVLLHQLNLVVQGRQLDRKNWPKAANALSGRLTRAAGHLRNVCIEISSERDAVTRTKILAIKRVQEA
jgi:hypothetical protein